MTNGVTAGNNSCCSFIIFGFNFKQNYKIKYIFVLHCKKNEN